MVGQPLDKQKKDVNYKVFMPSLSPSGVGNPYYFLISPALPPVLRSNMSSKFSTPTFFINLRIAESVCLSSTVNWCQRTKVQTLSFCFLEKRSLSEISFAACAQTTSWL